MTVRDMARELDLMGARRHTDPTEQEESGLDGSGFTIHRRLPERMVEVGEDQCRRVIVTGDLNAHTLGLIASDGRTLEG
jgi:hypothetical protein